MVVGNRVPVGQMRQLAMIGNDGGDRHRQRSGAVPIQEIVQAMLGFGHQYHHSGWPALVVQTPIHLELLGQWSEMFQ